MADCYYHGYSGSPGPCSQCERERSQGMEEGTLGLTIDDPSLVWDLANQNSIGRVAANKDKSKKKKKSR